MRGRKQACSETSRAGVLGTAKTAFAKLTASSAEPHVAYQLTVINSCLANEDVRLPRAPTPTLLDAFYTEYTVPSESTSSVPGASAALSAWKNEYWLRRVPHVPFGRHSALPAAFQLHHDCVSRLHARVVYVCTPALHKHFTRFFPPLKRSTPRQNSTTAAEEDVEMKVQVATAVERENDGGWVTIVSARNGRVPTVPFARNSVFTSPYYLLVNYSDNPVYVGHDAVPRGRSAELREGDVVSFLECAFDEEGGVLDDAALASHTPTSIASSGEGVHTGEPEGLAEPSQQLAHASLRRHISFSAAPASRCAMDSSAASSAFAIRMPYGTVGVRRLYDVPCMIQEYVKWWHAQVGHLSTPQPPQCSEVPPSTTITTTTSPTAAADTPWVVSTNCLVRAPSVTAKVQAAPSVDTVALQAAHDGTDAPHAFEAHMQRSNAAVVSLRQWLRDTEGMEDVADGVLSPLAARLTLDRSWLRRLVRQHLCQDAQLSTSATPASPHVTASPVKVDGKREDETVPNSAVKSEHKTTSSDAQQSVGPVAATMEESVAEYFRVSVSLLHDSPMPREPRSARAMLEELRLRSCSANEDDDGKKRNGEDRTNKKEDADASLQPPARRPLRLAADPIDVFDDATSTAVAKPPTHGNTSAAFKSARWAAAQSERSAAEVASPSLATGLPAVRLQPAALPVYLFTRRSLSPDVYTRERPTLHSSSTSLATWNKVATAAALNAVRYVYYLDEEEKHKSTRASAARKGREKQAGRATPFQPSSPALAKEKVERGAYEAQQEKEKEQQQQQRVPTASSRASSTARSSLDFEWIDEASATAKKQAATRKRRRRRRM